VLVTEVDGHWFAVTFDRGHSLLRHELLVSDFGLCTTANSLPPTGWQSVTTVSLRVPGRRTDQRLARPGDRGSFTVDVENEWTHTLGGVTSGDVVQALSGSEALRVRVPQSHRLPQLPDLLAHLLDRYRATDYRERFGFIDQVVPLSKGDPRCADLDQLITRRLHPGRGDGLTVVAPLDLDPESGLSFRLPGRRRPLHLDQLVHAASGSTKPLDIRVHVRDPDGSEIGTRPVREFLSAEAALDDGLPYVLSGGRWFAVARDYFRELKRILDTVPVINLELPKWYRYFTEETYNRQAADELSWLLLDRAPFRGLDRAHDLVEIADLVNPDMDFVF